MGAGGANPKGQEESGVLIEVRKSSAIWDIAGFVGNGIITMDELDGFSVDLIDIGLPQSHWL